MRSTSATHILIPHPDKKAVDHRRPQREPKPLHNGCLLYVVFRSSYVGKKAKLCNTTISNASDAFSLKKKLFGAEG